MLHAALGHYGFAFLRAEILAVLRVSIPTAPQAINLCGCMKQQLVL